MVAGALSPKRLRDFQSRYASFCDPDIPAFLYGSHYSTAAGVALHYLVRLEPFASLHVDLQGGKFDVADRLFKSVGAAFRVNYDEGSEVSHARAPEGTRSLLKRTHVCLCVSVCM